MCPTVTKYITDRCGSLKDRNVKVLGANDHNPARLSNLLRLLDLAYFGSLEIQITFQQKICSFFKSFIKIYVNPETHVDLQTNYSR